MVADLLHVDGFEDVDPQHPLGGPDGLKDVLCRKDVLRWVAAAYFPPTTPTFTAVSKKFTDDFAGVAVNDADAFAFFTNQPLTVAERKQLSDVASPKRAEIYHLERLRSLLDSPKGCGIRLQYLRIPMTEAEQWAFWSTFNQDLVRKLAAHEARREAQQTSMAEKLDHILRRTEAIEVALRQEPSHRAVRVAIDDIELPTSTLSVSALCWVHRIVTEGSNLPEAVRGRVRSVKVWITSAGGTPQYTPPPPEEIPSLMREFVEWWRQRHRQCRHDGRRAKVIALADLHHRLLRIHPFLDGNGRVARTLVDQAARELLNQSVGPEFIRDTAGYYAALAEADAGRLEPLQNWLDATLQ